MKTYNNPFEMIYGNKSKVLIMSERANLMVWIRDFIDDNKLTQSFVADVCGITQPRVSNLLSGSITKFTIESLMHIKWSLERSVLTKEKSSC